MLIINTVSGLILMVPPTHLFTSRTNDPLPTNTNIDTRVGKFLPVTGKNRFFSVVQTVLAKIFFSGGKN